MNSKPEYKTPTVTEIGSFEAITQGTNNQPSVTDFTYPAGTPFPDLTWS